jgi:predicted DNA binding protein
MATRNAERARTASEVEFRVTDPACFFVRASGEASCRMVLEHLIRRSDGNLLEFFAIDGVDPRTIVEMTSETPGIVETQLLREAPESGLVRFVVSGPCVTTTLADAGAVTRTVTASEGIGRVVASVPAHVEVRTVVESFWSRHPGSELLATRDGPQSVPVRTELGLKETFAGRLTDRQLEVLRTAYLSGYFEWPRESTAEECAEALGISQPTFSQHLRAAERAMSACLFETAHRRLSADGGDPADSHDHDH